MRQPMSARERMLLAFMVCVTVLALGPLTALAATGQLMNIVDSTNAARIAKVTDIGALQVQTRPGIASNSFNARATKVGGGWIQVYEIFSTTKATAVVEATLSSAAASGVGNYVYRVGYANVSSATACSSVVAPTSYWRELYLQPGQTLQLTFNGAPMQIGVPAAGRHNCVGVFVYYSPSGGSTSAGVSGYLYTP